MRYYKKIFKALSDETRIRIMKILLYAHRELCVCEIVDSLKIPAYSISRHMKELKYAGLVSERRDGRFILYKADLKEDDFDARLEEMLAAIPENEKDIRNLEKRLLRCRRTEKCKGE